VGDIYRDTLRLPVAHSRTASLTRWAPTR